SHTIPIPPRPSTLTSLKRPNTICPPAASSAVSIRQPGQPPSGASAGISVPHFPQTLIALFTAVFPSEPISNSLQRRLTGRVQSPVGWARRYGGQVFGVHRLRNNTGRRGFEQSRRARAARLGRTRSRLSAFLSIQIIFTKKLSGATRW